MNVLVVDDNVELLDLVERSLLRDGHHVLRATTLSEARDVLQSSRVDVLVLDLMLPDGSGTDLCRALRTEGSELPILMLTARTRVAARVESLDAGADDHVGKPFAVAELRARVRALGRRALLPSRGPVRIGSCELDFRKRQATREGRLAPITAREWEILELLASRHGEPVSRAGLLKIVWQDESTAAEASLEVLISRIRRKLGSELIRTVRGEGYALAL